MTQEKRYQIYTLLKAGNNQTQIAMILNRHKSTINRVIRRNTGLRGYCSQQAQQRANQRKDDKAYSRIGDKVWATVVYLIRQAWSPKQVSLWLKAEHSVSVSHE